MATRSNIGILETDGSVNYIYCHWDGYPEGVGKTLTENYTTTEMVEALLSLGDISTLGEDLDLTVAYHRDRGESFSPPTKVFSLNQFINGVGRETGAEWVYVWIPQQGSWNTYSIGE